ncbi:MAG: AAA family ATPase, partial [Cyanobacteria bacterium MAG APA_bin_95]|nr:AAA family ATPase [Cyanobacteria bacterium MAG APA_bin_95]
MVVPVRCAPGKPGLQPITIREQRVTDDLDHLLAVLPESLQQQLASAERRQDLLEVVLDLGRPPEARYPGRRLDLEDAPLSREALDGVIARVGRFGGDNRAGIARTLHRISAIRNRSGEVIGLTCRVGRAVYGTVAVIRDLVESNQSVLIMGYPG